MREKGKMEKREGGSKEEGSVGLAYIPNRCVWECVW